MMNRLTLRGEKEIALQDEEGQGRDGKKYLFQYSVMNDKLDEGLSRFH
ncbi:MAG: hypothetical protein MZU95_06400 [Desulfomicrobium escambiense]|nr:hypothetical protein [Desulfomicrobium escambiense]